MKSDILLIVGTLTTAILIIILLVNVGVNKRIKAELKCLSPDKVLIQSRNDGNYYCVLGERL